MIPKRRFAQDHFEHTRKGSPQKEFRLNKSEIGSIHMWRYVEKRLCFHCFGMLEMFIHPTPTSLQWPILTFLPYSKNSITALELNYKYQKPRFPPENKQLASFKIYSQFYTQTISHFYISFFHILEPSLLFGEPPSRGHQ